MDSIRAFSMDRGYGNDEVIITMIDTGHRGVMGYRAGHDSNRREYFSLGSLVILNKRNTPYIERYKQAAEASEAAEMELDAARKSLPHPTTEELQKLSAKRAAAEKAA